MGIRCIIRDEWYRSTTTVLSKVPSPCSSVEPGVIKAPQEREPIGEGRKIGLLYFADPE
jgi:hypothetical protein